MASDTPKVSTSETGNTSGADILYQDTDGGQISVDGKNWVAEADYEKNNAAPDVQWWTADEYEAWMNEQKKEMESLIGTGDGWYDGQGVFHEFTQESVDAMIHSTFDQTGNNDIPMNVQSHDTGQNILHEIPSCRIAGLGIARVGFRILLLVLSTSVAQQTAVLLGNSSTLKNGVAFPPRCNRTSPAISSIADTTIRRTCFIFIHSCENLS